MIRQIWPRNRLIVSWVPRRSSWALACEAPKPLGYGMSQDRIEFLGRLVIRRRGQWRATAPRGRGGGSFPEGCAAPLAQGSWTLSYRRNAPAPPRRPGAMGRPAVLLRYLRDRRSVGAPLRLGFKPLVREQESLSGGRVRPSLGEAWCCPSARAGCRRSHCCGAGWSIWRETGGASLSGCRRCLTWGFRCRAADSRSAKGRRLGASNSRSGSPGAGRVPRAGQQSRSPYDADT